MPERDNLAIGLVETKGVVTGTVALDAAVKAAPVEVLRAEAICPGKFIFLLAGETAAVQAAVQVAKSTAGAGLYDDFILAHVHPDVLVALLGDLPAGGGESRGIVETLTVASGIKAADAALKAATVQLCELRLGFSLGGRLYFVLAGTVSAVQAALDAACAVAVASGTLGDRQLIASPDAQLEKLLQVGNCQWEGSCC